MPSTGSSGLRHERVGALSTLSSVLPLPPISSSSSKRHAPTASSSSSNDGPSLLERRIGRQGRGSFSLGLDQLDGQVSGPRRSKPRSFVDVDDGIELPPSPSGLPGGWTWYSSVEEDTALLLPPPFLDQHSSKESFDGVLGTRSARQAAKQFRKEAMMYARDRPPPRPFPASLVTTASKLINALGPPGGLDSGSSYRKWQKQSSEPAQAVKPPGLKRAESSLRGRELGDRFASRLVQKLRREQVRRELDEITDGVIHDEPIIIDEDSLMPPPRSRPTLSAATPSSLLSAPPHLTNQFATESPSPLLSPPLPEARDSPTIAMSADDYAAFKPLKPRLGPTLEAADPSPFPDELESERDGYFASRKPSLRRRHRPSVKRQSRHEATDDSGVVKIRPRSLSTASSSSFRRWRHHRERLVAFLTWVLIGSAKPDSPSEYGGLASVVVFAFGFLCFLAVHLGALAVSCASTIRSVAVFATWAFLNLTGRTDLSRVFRSYFQLCRNEWEQVYQEDHVKLTFWSVSIGLLEVAAIQAMSKTRWLADGPGKLKLLNTDEAVAKALSSSPPSPARRRLPKRSLSMNQSGGEQMIVTGKEGSVMEATIFDPQVHLSSTSPYSLVPKDMSSAVTPLDLGMSAFSGFSLTPAVTVTEPHRLTRLPSLTASPPLHPIPEPDSLSTLITTIQRHARLATASYGLHSYIVAPPTPLFTPSGATLPQRVFGHLGGIDQKNVLHVAIQEDYRDLGNQSAAGPGQEDEEVDFDYSPQFYLLRDDTHSEVICVIRGTQSLADIRLDLSAASQQVELTESDGAKKSYHAHAGIVAAARRLLDPQASPLYEKLRATLVDNETYSLVFTGHSLGGAIASTLAFLVAELRASDERWVTSSHHGLPAGRFVRAYCFAHPTTIDLPLSRRCAQGKEPLVLSVSFGSDIVVRMGITQLREVRRALGRLEERRRRTFHPKGEGEHGKSEILRSWWRWKKLQSRADQRDAAEEDTAEARRQMDAIESKAWTWRREMEAAIVQDAAEQEHDAIDVDDEGRTKNLFMVPAGKCLHVDKLPKDLEIKRRKEQKKERECHEHDRHDDDEEDDETPLYGLYEVNDTRAFFACPHLEADAVAAHLPAVYLTAVEAL